MYLTETHNQELLPPDSTDTMYVSLLPDEMSSSTIFSKVKALNLPDIFPSNEFGLYPEDEYHTTLVFSRKNGTKLHAVALEMDGSVELFSTSAVVKCIRVLGPCLVLELESESLQAAWKKCMDAGASYDFPDYLPHISIGKFTKGITIQSEMIIESILPVLAQSLIGTEVNYDRVTSEPLSL